MKAAKFYALGGLFLVFWALMRTFDWQLPWLDRYVYGLSIFYARMLTWTLGAVLGAVALFLGAMQAQVAWGERTRRNVAVVYFFGAVLFLLSFYDDLQGLRSEETMSWPTATGLAILLAVLVLNMIGMVRHHEPVIEAEGVEK